MYNYIYKRVYTRQKTITYVVGNGIQTAVSILRDSRNGCVMSATSVAVEY